jgi:hypothetical protein
VQVVKRTHEQDNVNAIRRQRFQIHAGHLMVAHDLPVKASLAQFFLNRIQQARGDVPEMQVAASARQKVRAVAAPDADFRHHVACPRHTSQPSKRNFHFHRAVLRQSGQLGFECRSVIVHRDILFHLFGLCHDQQSIPLLWR